MLVVPLGMLDQASGGERLSPPRSLQAYCFGIGWPSAKALLVTVIAGSDRGDVSCGACSPEEPQPTRPTAASPTLTRPAVSTGARSREPLSLTSTSLRRVGLPWASSVAGDRTPGAASLRGAAAAVIRWRYGRHDTDIKPPRQPCRGGPGDRPAGRRGRSPAGRENPLDPERELRLQGRSGSDRNRTDQ